MAVSNLAIFPQTIRAWAFDLVNASGVTPQVLVTGGANGSIVESLTAASIGAATNQVLVYLNDGTTNHQLTGVTVANNAGNTAGSAVDILRSGQISGIPVDANGNSVIFVPNGWKLMVAANTTIASAQITCVAMGADF